MEDRQFDRLTRAVSGLATRRVTLAGLLGGLLLPILPEAAAMARNRRGKAVHAEKRRKKKCQSGLLTCKIKKGKKKKRFCVDAQTDPLNCGGCGNVCAASQTCQGGTCTCNGTLCAGCCDGSTCQGGNSHQQCGTNGVACQVCSGGRTCQNGVCACPAGRTFCNGACVDTQTDNANCGSCGQVCATPQTCQNGVCKCPGGQQFCNGACVDTKSDLANCGACGNDCPAGNDCNTATCTNGTCGKTPTPGVSCNGGLGTCNATGQCVATACAGKDAPNPCFEGIAPFCNAGNTCNCGSDLDGNVACYENAYCNNSGPQCASNADCVAMGFAAGSICFSATNCCIGATGCTTPCPS